MLLKSLDALPHFISVRSENRQAPGVIRVRVLCEQGDILLDPLDAHSALSKSEEKTDPANVVRRIDPPALLVAVDLDHQSNVLVVPQRVLGDAGRGGELSDAE